MLVVSEVNSYLKNKKIPDPDLYLFKSSVFKIGLPCCIKKHHRNVGN